MDNSRGSRGMRDELAGWIPERREKSQRRGGQGQAKPPQGRKRTERGDPASDPRPAPACLDSHSAKGALSSWTEPSPHAGAFAIHKRRQEKRHRRFLYRRVHQTRHAPKRGGEDSVTRPSPGAPMALRPDRASLGLRRDPYHRLAIPSPVRELGARPHASPWVPHP